MKFGNVGRGRIGVIFLEYPGTSVDIAWVKVATPNLKNARRASDDFPARMASLCFQLITNMYSNALNGRWDGPEIW